MKIESEGETRTIIKTRVRRECDGCADPATYKNTYLMPNARANSGSSAYGRDDCTWSSDYDQYLCSECHRKNHKDDVPDGYGWCSTFDIERMPHLFLRWDEQDIEPPAQAVA